MNKLAHLLLCSLIAINTLAPLKGTDNKSTKWYEDVFDFLFTERLGYTEVSKETENFVRSLQKELGMQNERIRIKRMSHFAEKTMMGKRNACVHSFSNLMIIGEKWFNTLSEPEKRALIGHELMHLKKHHQGKQLILALSTTAIANLLTNEIAEKMSSQTSVSPHRRLGNVLLVQMLLAIPNAILTSWYSRQCEREADILAARQLKCSSGGVQLFKRLLDEAVDPQSRFAFKRFLANLFASHPCCEERIKYLQELA